MASAYSPSSAQSSLRPASVIKVWVAAFWWGWKAWAELRAPLVFSRPRASSAWVVRSLSPPAAPRNPLSSETRMIGTAVPSRCSIRTSRMFELSIAIGFSELSPSRDSAAPHAGRPLAFGDFFTYAPHCQPPRAVAQRRPRQQGFAMLDLLIINPAGAHGITGGHPIYGELGTELIAVEPPLFCRLIAGYVRDRGYSVKIIDAEAERLNPESVARMALDEQPRLICIAVYGHQPSASSQQMVGAGECANEIKKLTDLTIIMVGGHPSALPERTLREEDVDYIGVGEGPLTITWLLDRDNGLLHKSRCPGLVWRDVMGRVHVNDSAPLIELDKLDGNAWDLLPVEKYRAHQWQCLDDLSKRTPYASIYTTLNCPFACSFCCISAPFGGGNSYRMRSPKAVVDEIEMLHERYGVSTLKITDEMFVLESAALHGDQRRHYRAGPRGQIKHLGL